MNEFSLIRYSSSPPSIRVASIIHIAVKNYMVIVFNFYTDLASFIAELIFLKLTFRGMISEWFFLILQLAPISVY